MLCSLIPLGLPGSAGLLPSSQKFLPKHFPLNPCTHCFGEPLFVLSLSQPCLTPSPSDLLQRTLGDWGPGQEKGAVSPAIALRHSAEVYGYHARLKRITGQLFPYGVLFNLLMVKCVIKKCIQRKFYFRFNNTVANTSLQ